MFTHTHVKAKTVTYSLADIIKYTTNLVTTNGHRQTHIYNKVKHTKPCLDFISKCLKENRWEMLQTFEGFKIILNGYGEFTEVVTDSGVVFNSCQIFEKMKLIKV
jgi:hypothetical protein